MYFFKQGLPILGIRLINALSFNCYVCYQMIHKLFWLNMYKVCQRLWKIYKAEINWRSLLIYGDLNYYYNVIYQPSLFDHINSRFMHSNQKFWKTVQAQFWAKNMDIIQMVLTLIRATRKTTL